LVQPQLRARPRNWPGISREVLSATQRQLSCADDSPARPDAGDAILEGIRWSRIARRSARTLLC
jgi:hypothetical protein